MKKESSERIVSHLIRCGKIREVYRKEAIKDLQYLPEPSYGIGSKPEGDKNDSFIY